MELKEILENILFFLAMINPASKVFLLSTMDPPYKGKDLFKVSVKSTIVAFLILMILAISGNFLLLTVFHVQIYSLNVAGGIVLFIIGLTAVRQGRFFEKSSLKNISDMSIVPLAAPLIAGPGTITATISFVSAKGVNATLICVSMALFINLILMLCSNIIGKTMDRIHAIGPLIRITGLIVAAIAVQMVLSGLCQWIKSSGF